MFSSAMEDDNLLANHRDSELFTSEFLDQPAIPPFLLNSEFLPNENDKLVKLNSKKLKDVADNDKCDMIGGVIYESTLNTDLSKSNENSLNDQYEKPSIMKEQNSSKTVEAYQNILSSKNISDFCKPSLSRSEMEEFAKYFKAKRVNLGFTQIDVSGGLDVMFKQNFSQTTICRFEALQLTYNNMCKIFPFLLIWLKEADSVVSPLDRNISSVVPLPVQQCQDIKNKSMDKKDSNSQFEKFDNFVMGRKRKKRACIDNNLRITLEALFVKNPRPSTKDLNLISQKLDIDRGVVRVWFCNRRQKEKKSSSFAATFLTCDDAQSLLKHEADRLFQEPLKVLYTSHSLESSESLLTNP